MKPQNLSKLLSAIKSQDPSVIEIGNDEYSSASNWLTTIRKLLKDRKGSLKAFVGTPESVQIAKIGQTSAGRHPSIHIETGLLARIKAAGYSNLVHQFEQPAVEEFDTKLNEAEDLMTQEIEFSGSTKNLIAAAIRVKHACKFPNYKFTPTTVEFAAENQINKSSSASFPTYQRKGNVIEQMIDEANRVTKQGFADPWKYPITRGFRLQIRSSENDELKLKIRVMYPYPGTIILIEDTFIIPFVNHFIKVDTFYIIGRSGQEISKMLIKSFDHKGVVRITSSDISAFDQNAVNDNIIMGFWILRSQLKLTSLEHKTFSLVCVYFCVSLAISKTKGQPARLFLKTKGVPSGSGFTNMIDTLINAIAFEYAHCGILATGRVLICGDDNIFDSTNVDFDNYCKVFKEVFNWTITPEKTQHFENWKRLSFLGFTWINGVRNQNLKLLINQCLWHSSFYTFLDKYERELARCASVLLNAINGAFVFKRMFPEIVKALHLGVDIRFLYLYGSAPPTSLPGVVSYNTSKTNLKIVGHEQAMLTHLNNGWNIR